MTEVLEAPAVPDWDVRRTAKFVETYTGRKFYPTLADPGAFSVIDIAHALSNQCRYSGHTRDFYSVAQHSCLLTGYALEVMKATPDEALQVLMHDGPEGYLVDIARPVKQYMPEYKGWDTSIDKAMRKWLGWEHAAEPDYLHEIDGRIVADERAALMSKSGNDWGRIDPLGVQIDYWGPREAEEQFLMRYAGLHIEVYGTPGYTRHDWHTGGVILHNGKPLKGPAIEVDFRGGVARVPLLGRDGMMIRDTSGGFPRPATAWLHGKFAWRHG